MVCVEFGGFKVEYVEVVEVVWSIVLVDFGGCIVDVFDIGLVVLVVYVYFVIC